MATSTLYGVKGRFVSLHRGVITSLIRRGVHPNTVTLLAIPVAALIAVSLISGLAAHWAWLLTGPLLLILMSLNAVDGALARSAGRASHAGAVMNEMVDRLGDLLILGSGLLLVDATLAGLTLGSVLAAEIIGLIGWGACGQRTLSGPMGKPDRALVIGISASLAAFLGEGVFVYGFGAILAGAILASFVRIAEVTTFAVSLDMERPDVD